MSNRSTPHSENAGLIRRPLFVTSLVATLAASSLTGCSWEGSSRSSARAYSGSSNYWLSTRAGLSDTTIDPASTTGQYDTGWYEQVASADNVPEWYVAEAKLRVNELETQRAEAQGQYLAQQAERSQKFAELDAGLQNAFASEQIAVADASQMSESIASDFQRNVALASAREAEIENQANLGDAIIRATMREREAQYEKLRSDAVNGWERAQAEHHLMKAQRNKVYEDGQSEIHDMMKIADMTESRTHAKLASIRAETEAVDLQTDARRGDLEQQVVSAGHRFSAQVSQLREQAATLEEQADATTKELLARAEALEAGTTETNFDHQVASADLDFMKVQADALHLTQQSQAVASEIEAETARRFAYANKFLQVAEADFKQQQASAELNRQHGLADVSVMRARADRLEREARADFVFAQAQAHADALREEALHVAYVADAEFEKVRAEAEAQAAVIQADVMKTLASQFASGNVTFDRQKFEQNDSFETPAVTPIDVATVPSVVQPGHVVAFKTALGEAALLQAQASAFERQLFADFQEQSTKAESGWTIAQAQFDEFTAEIDAMQTQGDVNIASLAHDAAKLVLTGDAEMGYSKVDAESIKKEVEAAIINLRAEATATSVKADAAVTQLLSEANVVQTAGAAEIRSLEARRDAVVRRGTATVRQLRAEAKAIESTQGALIAQMRQEVRSAQAILTAELARLDQAAESFVQIGEATYEESVAAADSFNYKTKALVEQMYAQNDAARLAAKADVEHLRAVARADELIGLGQIERLMARAEADTNVFASFDTAHRAAIDAEGRVAEAQLAASLTKTNAQEETIKAVFDARLAGVKADRNRAFARQFINDAQQEARVAQAQAAADAYRQLSTDALAQLQDKRNKFEMAAQDNWDSRLALPTRLLTDGTAGPVWNTATGAIGVANVPLED